MSKAHTKATIVILVLIVVLVVVWRLLSNQGPLYNGKSVHAWLIQYSVDANINSSNVTNDEKAILYFGTNCVSALLDMAVKHDSSLKKLELGAIPNSIRFRRGWLTEDEYSKVAFDGLSILGQSAKPAIPALIKYLGSPDPATRGTAAQLLGVIGPAAYEAVPALILKLNDDDVLVQDCVRLALGSIHSRPELVVPLLMADIRPTNRATGTHIASMIALGNFKRESSAAVPLLVELENDPDLSTRQNATNALKQITDNPVR